MAQSIILFVALGLPGVAPGMDDVRGNPLVSVKGHVGEAGGG